MGARERTDNILCYELSNNTKISPVLYAIPSPDIPESGTWATPGIDGKFKERGKADIAVSELTYTRESEERIRTIFGMLDISIKQNVDLMAKVQTIAT